MTFFPRYFLISSPDQVKFTFVWNLLGRSFASTQFESIYSTRLMLAGVKIILYANKQLTAIKGSRKKYSGNWVMMRRKWEGSPAFTFLLLSIVTLYASGREKHKKKVNSLLLSECCYVNKARNDVNSWKLFTFKAILPRLMFEDASQDFVFNIKTWMAIKKPNVELLGSPSCKLVFVGDIKSENCFSLL